jgi:hypothetical protein
VVVVAGALWRVVVFDRVVVSERLELFELVDAGVVRV